MGIKISCTFSQMYIIEYFYHHNVKTFSDGYC